MIYFDNNATTPVYDEVIDVMCKTLKENYGNPSAVYQLGQKSKQIIETAREDISKILGVKSKEIIFTSGATEANNMAINGLLTYDKEKNHIITTEIEHPSILNHLKDLEIRGYNVTYLKVDKDGQLDLKQLKNSITTKTALISTIYVNNELGTILPVDKIGKIAHENNVPYHVDGVQAFGKLDIDLTNIDLFSLSAHKFGGAKGVGLLYMNSKIKFNKLIFGGMQERNRRAGTENTAGIAGMAKAMEITYENLSKNINYLKELKDYFEAKIVDIDGIIINGKNSNRSCNCSNITIAGCKAEFLLMSLDLRGFAISAGSACSSGSLSPSTVLKAIGLNDENAKSTIRVSFWIQNSKEEIDQFVDNLKGVVELEKKFS